MNENSFFSGIINHLPSALVPFCVNQSTTVVKLDQTWSILVFSLESVSNCPKNWDTSSDRGINFGHRASRKKKMTRQQEKKMKIRSRNLTAFTDFIFYPKLAILSRLEKTDLLFSLLLSATQSIRSICLIAATALLSLNNNLKERKPFLEMICLFLRSKRKRKYFRLCATSIRVYLTLEIGRASCRERV